MDRRKFLKSASLTTLGSVAAGLVYPFLEAKWCRVVRRTIALPNLPSPFRGTTIALSGRCAPWPVCATGLHSTRRIDDQCPQARHRCASR